MDKKEIKEFLDTFIPRQNKTIVIVDFANVDKWQKSLSWKVGIQELGRLVKHFSKGNKELRRFYYGFDYGPHENSSVLNSWSNSVITRAKINDFNVVGKRVKYIHESNHPSGFNKKCDLDVEMTTDLIRLKDEYDNIVLFSGDGDLVYVLKYLKEAFGKYCYVFGSRNHVGREVIDASKEGIVARILNVEDFEYRLNADRFLYP